MVSSVKIIVKDVGCIKEAVKGMADIKLMIITKQQEAAISEMEKLFMLFFSAELYTWCIFGLGICDTG